MSDRTVVVRLVAMVGQYRAAMAESAAVTRSLDAQMLATNRTAAMASKGLIASQQSALSGMTSTVRSMRGLMLGLGVPLALGAMVKSFLSFEQQMAHTRAVADSFGRSTAGFDALSNAALRMGQRFGFSAVEVGQAQEALIKAGRTTAQVLGGELSAALTLAAAGTISLDDAAKITAVTMTVFKDETLSAADVADELTGAANATVSGVQEMGNALSYVGPLAASLGVTFKDTVATISVFNQAGIDGERAGTNLRGMLTNLLSPSHAAQLEMTRLGIDLFNNEGHFIGMSKAAQMLHDRFLALAPGTKDLTHLTREQADAVGKLTTNASMPGFITLMRGGAAAVDVMSKAIADSASAEEVAADKLNSVTGEMKKFGSAIEAAAIQTGARMAPALGELTKGLTAATHGFSNLGGAGQLALLALGAQLLMARRVHTSFQNLSGSIGSATKAYRDLALMQQRGGIAPRGFIGPLLPTAPGAEAPLLRAAAEARGLSGGLGQLRGEFQAATTNAGRLGAIGAASMRGIAAAGRGLVSFLGGPFGVALAGAMIGVTIWQAKVADNKRVTDSFHEALAQLGQDYRVNGMITDENIKAMVREGHEKEWLVASTRQLGVSMTTVARAAAGQGPAINEVSKSLSEYEKRVMAVRDAIGGGAPLTIWDRLRGQQVDVTAGLSAENLARLRDIGVKPKSGDWAHTDVKATLDRLDAVARNARTAREEFEKTHRAEALLAKAMDDLNTERMNNQFASLGTSADEASAGMTAMATNLATMNSAEAQFSDRITAMTNNVSMLANAFHSVVDAQSAFYAASQEGLRGAFREDIQPWEPGGVVTGGGGAAQKFGTSTTTDESLQQRFTPGKAAQDTTRIVTGGKAPTKPVPDKVSTTRNADGTVTTVTTKTLADGTKQIHTHRTALKATSAMEKTTTRTTTTRNPDGTTVVSTATTDAQGNTTVDVRRSHDPADTRKPVEKPKPTPTRAVAPRLDPITGQFDVSDPSGIGRKQNAAMVTMADASAKTVVDTFTQVALAGKNTGEAMEFAGVVATAAFAKQRAEAIKALQAVGMNKDMAKQLVDAYYALPAEVATHINAPGAEQTIADLDKLHLQLVTMPGGKVSIVSNTKVQADQIAAFGGKVKKLPNGKYRIDFANQTKAQAALDGIIRKIDRVPAKVTTVVDAKTKKADDDLKAILARKDQVATGIDIWLNAHPQRAAQDLQNFKAILDAEDNRILDVWIRTQEWNPGLMATQNARKAAAEAAERKAILANPGIMFGGLDKAMGLWDPYNNVWVERPRRWGGIREAAGGSLRGAELAGPGTRYQWAEPETGGEAFIPRLGDASRSAAILATAAGWYGLGVHKMAGGGTSWSGQQLSKAATSNVVITVRGEGALSGMIEATVDGRLVKVAQTVAHGRVR